MKSNMTVMPPNILVFIPMYNCEPQIPRVLNQLNDTRLEPFIRGVICVDNRSTDGTRDAASEGLEKLSQYQRTLLHNNDNYGLGGSHKVAIEYAQQNGFDYLLVLHGDDQGSIGDMVPHLQAGHHQDTDFLMGARFMHGSKLEGYSFLRTAANQTFNLLFSLVSGRRLYDLGSGLNLFRVSAFENEFHKRFADDLTFNYYLILAVAASKYKLRFFPLTWREDDQISNARLSKMGFQILGLLRRRVFSAKSFFDGEHRQIAREEYSSSVIKTWQKQESDK